MTSLLVFGANILLWGKICSILMGLAAIMAICWKLHKAVAGARTLRSYAECQ